MAAPNVRRGVQKSSSTSSKFGRKWKQFLKQWYRLKKHLTFSKLTKDPEAAWMIAYVLFFVEVFINVFVIERIKYTEIDWKAYMQEVEGVTNGTFDYMQLKGDTGPLVYPAGFVYIFLLLYVVTGHGTNIYLAQYIYACLYLATLLLVFRLYLKTKKVPSYALVFMCCTSYRIHSIYVLRLFNDPVAMLFLYAAVNCFLSSYWTIGCILYSLAVSVKMNILLFAPALLILLIATKGIIGAAINIGVCCIVQIILGLPFLLTNPMGYIMQAFNLGRVFLYQWTVNWRFLPEEIFLDRRFHIMLLFLHIIVLLLFLWQSLRYLRLHSLFNIKSLSEELSPDQIMLPLFVANFVGMVFSRSLHYQFYVWYFHSLPYLLWSTNLPSVTKLCILGLIELSWNIYPSTILSSLLLHFCHLVILVSIWLNFPTRAPKVKV